MGGTNPVGAWVDTAYASQTATSYPAAVDADMAVLKRIGDRYAPRPHSTPNMTIDVDPGCLFLGGAATVENGLQTTPTLTAPGSNSRIDYVVGDNSTGVISVVTGVASASPVAPSIPSGKFPIALITLNSATTTLQASNITDVRVLPAAAVQQAATPTVVASGSFSGVASGTIGLPSGYVAYEIYLAQIQPATNNVQLQGIFQDSISGDIAGGNRWSYMDGHSNTASVSSAHSNNDTSVQLMHAMLNGGQTAHCRITLQADAAGQNIFANFVSGWFDTGGTQFWNANGSIGTFASHTMSGLKIRASSGNISFTYRVVGTP